MSLVYEQTGSGLVVAQQGADYQSVLRALKQHDSRLRLLPVPSGDTTLWKVMMWCGNDRPAETVLQWVDDITMRPRPLSHAIVDAVKQLDRNSRAPRVDDLAYNEALKAKRREETLAEIEARGLEELPRTKRLAALHRGQHLRLARDKTRRLR